MAGAPNVTPQWTAYPDSPTSPSYIVGFDPATMNLTDYLQGKYDTGGMNAFKAQAMRTGPSAWANQSRDMLSANTANAREKGAKESAAQTAMAMDNLSSHGGLSSGARERASNEGAKNYLAMSQDLGRQEGLNSLQIGVNDEQNRIQQLGMLPGMEMEQAKMYEGAKQQDIANTLSENERRNQWNQNLYGQQMQAWAANKQADATRHSGKKG